jgi:signal transduction histidine kinase
MSQNIIQNIIVIIWKKVEEIYRCFMSNNKINNNLRLQKYLKRYKISYTDLYDKLISTKEHQTVTINDIKIVLEYINDETILELHIPIDDNLYLLSSISHKIRNPLTNIMGVLTLIEEEKLDKTQKKYINILKKSSYDIVSVANDIVDIINLSRDEIKFNFGRTNIEKLLQECHNIMIKDTDSKKISFKTSCHKMVPSVIIVDSGRLKQVIINLLNNAINYTSIGGITLEVLVNGKEENLNNPFTYIESKPPFYNILFKIKDTGTGMDEDGKKFVNKILCIDKSENVKQFKYGGFGLLIGRYLCQLMGGNMWYKTEKDIGTIFYFNIICEGIVIQ